MNVKVVILFVALGLTMLSSYVGLKLNKDHLRVVGKKIGQLHEDGLVSVEVRELLQEAKDTAKENFKVSLWSGLVSWLIAVLMSVLVVRDHRQLSKKLTTQSADPAG